MRPTRRVPLLLCLLLIFAPLTASPVAAVAGQDMHYNVISGVPFAEIHVNETGESPYMLNVTAWGLRADSEIEYVERSDDVRDYTFGVIFRWDEAESINTGERRWMECWGGQRNASNLGWKQVSLADIHNLPLGYLVAPDDLHLANGTYIGSTDAQFHFRLNPQNGTEVFSYYEQVQIALFNRLSVDITDDDPRQIHQFTVREDDRDRWLTDAVLGTTTTTQSAEQAGAPSPGIVPVAVIGLVGLAGLVLGHLTGRIRGRR